MNFDDTEELKTVKEWLPDFYANTDGNTIRGLIGRTWDCEVESVEAANSLVNSHIDSLMSWLNGFRR